jgi:hypothetical protein
MGPSFKLFSLLVLGVVSLLMAAWSLVGVLQAGTLFTGERALRNLQIWGVATVLFLACAALFFVWAWRLARRHRAAAAQHLAARRSYAQPASHSETKAHSDE